MIALLQWLCSFYSDARALRIFALLYLLTGLGWLVAHPRAHGGADDEAPVGHFIDAFAGHGHALLQVAVEDKNLSASDVGKASTAKGVQDLLGFSMPDFSDPFTAIGSLDAMMADDSTKQKETYTPKRSTFFDYFPDEEDEGAPSYFNIGSGGGFGSLFG